jgi:hypothetical protein
MGKQNHGSTDVGCTPDVAGTQAIFRDNGKTIVIQRGSASRPRDSSSRGRGRVAGNVICNVTGAARQTDCNNSSNEQGQHGCDDGTDGGAASRKRWRQTHSTKPATDGQENITPDDPTAKHLSFTNLQTVLSSTQTRTSAGQAGSWSMPPPDRDLGHEQ